MGAIEQVIFSENFKSLGEIYSQFWRRGWQSGVSQNAAAAHPLKGFVGFA